MEEYPSDTDDAFDWRLAVAVVEALRSLTFSVRGGDAVDPFGDGNIVLRQYQFPTESDAVVETDEPTPGIVVSLEGGSDSQDGTNIEALRDYVVTVQLLNADQSQRGALGGTRTYAYWRELIMDALTMKTFGDSLCVNGRDRSVVVQARQWGAPDDRMYARHRLMVTAVVVTASVLHTPRGE